MLARIFNVLILIPIAIVLIALSVANRGSVPVSLDVFNPANPLLTFNAPMFVWMFGALAVGIIIGGIVTWWSQGYYRRRAREQKRESDKLRFEMEDTKRKADITDATPGQALVLQREN